MEEKEERYHDDTVRALYKEYKALLFTIAYQLTGSVSDGEDIVQDVFIKIYDVHPEKVENPKAYLCRMVINRSQDLLKSARKRREQYVGQWLPEPILTTNNPSLESVIRNEMLSYALLVLLEKLSPVERAVFVLREAIGLEYPMIAEIVSKNEINCRKLYSRSKGKLGIASKDINTNPQAGNIEWVKQFLQALKAGNISSIINMLSEDVTLVSDGGGKVSAALYPIKTPNHVARFLLGLFRKAPVYKGGVHIEITDINYETGLIIRTNKEIEAVVLLRFDGEEIGNIYFVRNPDKLHLGLEGM